MQTTSLELKFLNLRLVLKVPYIVIIQARERCWSFKFFIRTALETRAVSDFSLNGRTKKTAIPNKNIVEGNSMTNGN